MSQCYNYSTQRGALGREHRATFGDIDRTRGQQRFLATNGQRSLRMHDTQGNLLFRVYYRPYF